MSYQRAGMSNYFQPFVSCLHYHVFNHAVGDENLFRKRENYIFFLERYATYIHPVAHTFAYCLLPNHFHFLIQIRTAAELEEHYIKLQKPGSKTTGKMDVSKFVMQQFSNFFNSYAKAYNKRYDRKGALFIDYVRRSVVEDEIYFTNLVRYIHQNPVHHGMCKNADDWAFSSLHSIICNKKTNLERNVVLDWFGGIEKFIAFQPVKNVVGTDDLEFN